LPLDSDNHVAAPFFLHRAIEHEAAVCRGAPTLGQKSVAQLALEKLEERVLLGSDLRPY
jgi:hypothetical protein